MRKRSGQVHSRESSATLQLTVSLLYLCYSFCFLFLYFCSNICIGKNRGMHDATDKNRNLFFSLSTILMY